MFQILTMMFQLLIIRKIQLLFFDKMKLNYIPKG